MKKIFFSFFMFTLIFAQGLFESAQSSGAAYELNGDIRSAFLLEHENDSLYIKDIHARADIRLKAEAGKKAYAFTELVFHYGHFSGKDTLLTDLREAYVDLTFGPFHTRLGKQIEIWGRADAFQLTDNISPKDLQRVYNGPDDMRMGNLMLNSSIRFGGLARLQGIWIPVYQANKIPAGIFEMPENVTYTGLRAPDPAFKNSGAALRLDLVTSDYDAGFSYLNAYALQPGFASEMTVNSPADIRYDFFQKAWRQQVFGIDAAFTAGAWSFRFEGTSMIPDRPGQSVHIPEKEIQWSFGTDRSLGSLRILLEYSGKLIPEFSDAAPPQDPALFMDYRLLSYKRLLFRQQEKVQHSLFVRPSLTLFHETFEMEVPFLYHFITGEYMFSPAISIKPADALRFRMGATVYNGDDDTLFELLSELYNGFFAEIKVFF
ncbi:MAG: DUF1302 family protein [Fidelibacterota bacterium]